MSWRSTSTGGRNSPEPAGEQADECSAASTVGLVDPHAVGGPTGGEESLSWPKRLFHNQRRGSAALSPGRSGAQHCFCPGLDHACLDLGTPDRPLFPTLSRRRLRSSLTRRLGAGDGWALPESAGSGHPGVDPAPGAAPYRPGRMVDGSLAGLDRRGAVWNRVAQRGRPGR